MTKVMRDEKLVKMEKNKVLMSPPDAVWAKTTETLGKRDSVRASTRRTFDVVFMGKSVGKSVKAFSISLPTQRPAFSRNAIKLNTMWEA